MKYPKIITLFWLFLLHELALANSESPTAQGLGWIIKEMQGGTGLAIATLAIMGVGLLCLGRVIEWKWLLYTIGGIAILFGAGTIASGIKLLIHS